MEEGSYHQIWVQGAWMVSLYCEGLLWV